MSRKGAKPADLAIEQQDDCRRQSRRQHIAASQQLVEAARAQIRMAKRRIVTAQQLVEQSRDARQVVWGWRALPAPPKRKE